MTDREKLIRIIDSCRSYVANKEELVECLIANGVRLESGQATSDENKRWIPVSERLPDTSGDYLTRCHHYRNGDWSEVVPFDVDKNYFADLGGNYYPFVTHWMPLPEPPLED